MNNRKIVGAGFTIVALVTIGFFMVQTDFTIQLHSYFSLKYCMQFVPLVISLLLLFGGVSLFVKRPKANFVLAIFGYAALEEILFDWFGVASSYLSTYSMALFFCSSIIALWVAHSNAFNLKRLSIWGVVFSVAFGAIESLLPNYVLQFFNS